MSITPNSMIKPAQNMRTCGFRVSKMDAFVLGVVLIGVIVLKRMMNPLWWMVAVVIGHFFLFCNVFRVRRSFELSWAVLFIINAAAWLYVGKLEWPNVVACQFPITTAFIILELRSPRYHGIFARRVNPRLEDYLKGRRL